MGIIDKVTGLFPRRDDRAEFPAVGGEVLALRDNLDRWLDRFFEEPWGFRQAGDVQAMRCVNIEDTDDALIVSVDVPGFDREGLDVTVTPQGLIVRGESRQPTEDRRKRGAAAGERYEQFTEMIPLPPGLDIDRAEAHVQRGRLTVTFPKSTQTARRRQIAIRA
jgi:HSP20 family protein